MATNDKKDNTNTNENVHQTSHNDDDDDNDDESKRTYYNRRIRPEDWPWIWAIQDDEQLDWRLRLREQMQDHNNKQQAQEEEERIWKQQQELPIKLMDGLYISDAYAVAAGAQKLREEVGITHILNVGGQEAQFFGRGQGYFERFGFTYKSVEASDTDDYPLLDLHWKECKLFLDQALANGNGDGDGNDDDDNATKVVVHCAAGINRSGLIATAYYMMKHRVSVLEAVHHCRKCRGTLLWNHSFQRQLVALAREEGLLGPAPGTEGCDLVKKSPPPLEETREA